MLLSQRNLFSGLLIVGSLILMFAPLSSLAAPACESVFSENTKSADAPALTPSQVRVIKEHFISRRFPQFGKGEKISFSSMHFTDKLPDTLYKGEYLQAKLIRSILSTLFPEAQFITSSSQLAPGRQEVRIVIADLAEKFSGNMPRMKKIIDQGLVIPMHLVKATNSSRIPMDKKALRASMGIPEERKVVSIYVRSEDTLTSIDPGYRSTQFGALLNSIKQAFPFDTLILSFGNSARGMHFQNSGIFDAGINWNQTMSAGQLLSPVEKPPFDGLTLIKNDTVGSMLKLHAVADLAVVVGPVNFIEPLRVGTKTLLLQKNNSESRQSDYGSYDVDMLNELVGMAMPVGILRSSEPFNRFKDNYAAVPGLIHELLNARDTGVDLSVALMPDLLDVLGTHLEYQFYDYKAQDYIDNGLR